ncbi:hypothetical protein HY771_01610 [Candidatus Uhrbacteria bacterium]|nr:hypothetical protein [Candidatus Uhrbacteria bacterium]
MIAGSLAINTLPKNTVQVESGAITDILRKVQSRSVSGYQDSVWGVHFTATEITLFAGMTFESRNQIFDETSPLSSGVNVSGLTDVVFQFGSGGTQNIGDVVLTSSATGEIVTLSINSYGRIQKQ